MIDELKFPKYLTLYLYPDSERILEESRINDNLDKIDTYFEDFEYFRKKCLYDITPDKKIPLKVLDTRTNLFKPYQIRHILSEPDHFKIAQIFITTYSFISQLGEPYFVDLADFFSDLSYIDELLTEMQDETEYDKANEMLKDLMKPYLLEMRSLIYKCQDIFLDEDMLNDSGSVSAYGI